MAYMRLAKEHHPDYGGDVEKFVKINNAYKQMKKKYLASQNIQVIKKIIKYFNK